MECECLPFHRSFLVAALGFVCALALSEAFALGYAPAVGALSGAFLGLVNFMSLYRFGKLITSGIGYESGCTRTGEESRDSRRTRPVVLRSLSLRFPMVVAGLAVVARYLGISGLLLCTAMLFAVQIPLFVSLGRIAKGGITGIRPVWR